MRAGSMISFNGTIVRSILIFAIITLIGGELACAEDLKYRLASPHKDPGMQKTVVGCIRTHIVKPGETLLDVARDYGLGFNEIEILYPQIDPWIPEPGLQLVIPTKWVLPSTRYQGVVINLPELRLYRFFPRKGLIKTYPIGVGDMGRETPKGIYRVAVRQVDPVWTIPKSLRKKYKVTRIPPGPDNPLGKYWIGLSRKGYGIHGTDFPWGVGRLVSNGCIRLYPEHIAQLFQEVHISTPVEIIYELVKIGVENGEIFMEVHPDLYDKTEDMEEYARKRIEKSGFREYISMQNVKEAIKNSNGLPVRVGTIKKGGADVATPEEDISADRDKSHLNNRKRR